MDFYYAPASAPCRSVQIAATALGVTLNLKPIDLGKKEHLTPEYLKINPQHTVPSLVDEGFILWESRAILTYLAENYGKSDSLYPKDPTKRAVVNQRLYFDMGTLSQKFSQYYYPQIFAKAPADPEKLKALEDAVEVLNLFLKTRKFTAGENLTLADIAISTTISNFEAAGFDLGKYPNVTRWYKLCKTTIPGWEINVKGIELSKAFMAAKK